jgi:hypothetical protein
MMQKHRKLSDEFSEKDVSKPKANFLKSSIGAQPALYDANIMLEPDHAPPDVRSDSETKEIEDRTREKLVEQLKDPMCIANNIVFHYDYNDDNHSAIFVPQKKIFLDQIFWNIDLEKMKAEKLEGNTRTIFKRVDPTLSSTYTHAPFTINSSHTV